MLDGNFRATVDRSVRPIGTSMRKAGLTADHLTILGVVLSLAAAVSIALGHLRLGLLLVVLTGLCDTLDGAIAKSSGTSSPRGAFFDSVSDRVSDALLFGGVAWYFASTTPGLLVMLPVAALGLAQLISYERAKAEALGFTAKGGIMERAERLILLSIGLLFDPLLAWVLVVMVVLMAVTAVQRFVMVWRQASTGRPARAPRRATRRRRPRPATRRGSWSSRTAGGRGLRSRRSGGGDA